jgi:NADPH:quinone reductase-like Zn-dependent oxidoreductase/acyl carrier protein
MVFRRPPNMSTEEAATVLVAYLTAGYALHNLGRMKRGDRVLIHAAAGGVGLAAVQCALLAGAEVFATAGSAAKRKYLRHLGVQQIMDSRSLDFSEQIREITRGEGIDLVLNSLTGDAIPHGLSVLRAGGRFLEIGKNELWTAEQVARVNPGASYHVIDLLEPFRATPEVMHQLFDELSQRFAEGTLRPLPRRVFTLAETIQAFRYMATARHIGKIVVVDPSTRDSFELHDSGTYLITGGLGGIGLTVARWMVAQGARRLVLVGRRAPTAEALKAIQEMQQAGAEVIVAQADIARRSEVAALLAAHGSLKQPWRGVIHAAGVIDDGALVLQDKARFERVLAPKTQGAWNLHELTMHLPLDFFVLFSSGAGLFGNAGQGSYAAANAFMDTLALARQAAGLPALSINWGPWSEVGMVATMDKRHAQGWEARGLSAIDPARGVRALEQLMERPGTAQAAVLPMDESAWQRQFQGQQVPPLLASLIKADVQAGKSRHGQQDVAERLRNALPNQKLPIMIEVVCDILLEVFGFDAGRTIPTDQNLAMLGMDSLLAIQFSNRLKTSFNCSLPPTLTFEYPTIEAIAGYLLTAVTIDDHHSAIEPQIAPHFAPVETMTELGQNFDPQQAQNILANLDRLSDQDVDAMLNSFDLERETR